MSAATLEEKKTSRSAESKVSPKTSQARRDRAKQRCSNRADGPRVKRTSVSQLQPKAKRQTHRIDPAKLKSVKQARRAAMQRKAPAREVARRAAELEQPTVHRADDGWHFSIEKLFVYFSYALAITLCVIFGLDLLTGIPFRRANILYDVANVVGGLTLAFLAWNTHRDLM